MNPQDGREPVIPYAGPTTPRREYPFVKGMVKGVLVTASLAASAGVALFVIGSTSTRCRGSTRSARLEWEARQEQVAREIAAEVASAAPICDVRGEGVHE